MLSYESTPKLTSWTYTINVDPRTAGSFTTTPAAGVEYGIAVGSRFDNGSMDSAAAGLRPLHGQIAGIEIYHHSGQSMCPQTLLTLVAKNQMITTYH